MKSRTTALLDIFQLHGTNAVYIVSTGYIARATYSLFSHYGCIFYMNGSMGLAPGIGLGIALNSEKDVIVISGDASLLMHLGLTHTIRDCNLDNLHVYVLDNNCHESVGSHRCSALEKSYPGIKKIISINREGKSSRVGVGFAENANQIKNFLKVQEQLCY